VVVVVCGRAKVVKCVVPSSTSFSAFYKRTGPGHADGEDDIVDRRTKWERGVGSRRKSCPGPGEGGRPVREWGRGEPPALRLTLSIVPRRASRNAISKTGVAGTTASTYALVWYMALEYPRAGIAAYENTPSRVETGGPVHESRPERLRDSYHHGCAILVTEYRLKYSGTTDIQREFVAAGFSLCHMVARTQDAHAVNRDCNDASPSPSPIKPRASCDGKLQGCIHTERRRDGAERVQRGCLSFFVG
jgi:hypothetical protein